jgi:site-specific recombinase XerD
MKKTEANFYLQKRKDTKTGEFTKVNIPILMIYSLGIKQRLEYYTGLRVDLKYWDELNMKVKKGYPDYQVINTELARLKAKAENEVKKAKILGLTLTIEELKQLIKTNAVITDIKVNKNFWGYYDEFKEHLKVTKAESSVTTYNTTFNVLRKFEAETKYKLTFNRITMDFYDKLLNFCFTELNHKNNTVGNCIKNLKAFLNWATENKYNANKDFESKWFKKLKYDTEILYLLWDELMYLYHFNLKKHKKLDLLRDRFCFGCFTGLRLSDIDALIPANLQKNELQIRGQKTANINSIPLNNYSKAIIAKYKTNKTGKLLPPLHKSLMTPLFKELFSIVKLDRKVQTVGYQGAKRIEQTKTIGEAITFHISKKTFMTTFLANGGSLETAMAITGNKTHASAKRYFTVVETKKREDMDKVFNR